VNIESLDTKSVDSKSVDSELVDIESVNRGSCCIYRRLIVQCIS
jgi:hypothetical protein